MLQKFKNHHDSTGIPEDECAGPVKPDLIDFTIHAIYVPPTLEFWLAKYRLCLLNGLENLRMEIILVLFLFLWGLRIFEPPIIPQKLIRTRVVLINSFIKKYFEVYTKKYVTTWKFPSMWWDCSRHICSIPVSKQVFCIVIWYTPIFYISKWSCLTKRLSNWK